MRFPKIDNKKFLPLIRTNVQLSYINVTYEFSLLIVIVWLCCKYSSLGNILVKRGILSLTRVVCSIGNTRKKIIFPSISKG